MAKVYCTKEEIQAETGLDPTKYGTAAQMMINAASRAIDNYCKRPMGFVADIDASTRDYVSNGDNWIAIDECVEITSVAVKTSYDASTFTSWAATDWIAYSGANKSPNFNDRPYSRIMCNPSGAYTYFVRGGTGSYPQYDYKGYYSDTNQSEVILVPTVRVTARWGYAEDVPNEISQACIIQASRWIKRAQSAWADAIGNETTGELRFTRNLDPDIKFLLNMGSMVRHSIGKTVNG